MEATRSRSLARKFQALQGFVDDVVIVVEDCDSEFVAAQIFPDVLDRASLFCLVGIVAGRPGDKPKRGLWPQRGRLVVGRAHRGRSARRSAQRALGSFVPR